jgi:hypothetical protein
LTSDFMKVMNFCRINTYEKLDKILQKNQTKSDIFFVIFGLLKTIRGFFVLSVLFDNLNE